MTIRLCGLGGLPGGGAPGTGRPKEEKWHCWQEEQCEQRQGKTEPTQRVEGGCHPSRVPAPKMEVWLRAASGLEPLQRPTLPLLMSAGGACALGPGWGGPTHHLPSPFILRSPARRPTLPPASAAGSLPSLQVTLVIWFPAGLKRAWPSSLTVLASGLEMQSRCYSSPPPPNSDGLGVPCKPLTLGRGRKNAEPDSRGYLPAV